jgi:hypothetical protein
MEKIPLTEIQTPNPPYFPFNKTVWTVCNLSITQAVKNVIENDCALQLPLKYSILAIRTILASPLFKGEKFYFAFANAGD